MQLIFDKVSLLDNLRDFLYIVGNVGRSRKSEIESWNTHKYPPPLVMEGVRWKMCFGYTNPKFNIRHPK